MQSRIEQDTGGPTCYLAVADFHRNPVFYSFLRLEYLLQGLPPFDSPLSVYTYMQTYISIEIPRLWREELYACHLPLA